MDKDMQKEMEKEYREKTPMPKVDFITFVMSLSSSALANLGEVPDPITNKTEVNLELARHTIDVLGMLEEKTKGNLSKEEEEYLKSLLFELRMKYVQKCCKG